MRTFFSSLKVKCSQHRGELLSLVSHLCLLLGFFGGIRLSPRVAPMRLPGTALGAIPLPYYSPGSVHPIRSESQLKSRQKTIPPHVAHLTTKAAKQEQTQPAPSQTGTAVAAQSGIGEGDITIALQTVFLYPNPDLSGLPRGTKGDVILNAVIDEQGKISELTLLKGLGSPVDETVIAVVRQWQYTPAKKNGVPVVSEQELHFHYERG